MSEVVEFPVKETGYWQCGCGCLSFFLREDGEVECAQCEGEPKDTQGWWRAVKDVFQESDEDPKDIDIVKIGLTDLSVLSFAEAVKKGEPAITILIYESGRVRTLGSIYSTRAARGWLNKQLAVAKKNLTNGAT